MANIKIPKPVAERLIKQVPRYQKLLKNAGDINEADTVTIVIDMLNEVFGFDKYSEITKEHSIRKTFCDVAVKIEGKIRYLVEVKAIGKTLSDNHIRQAVNYAAGKEEVDWAVLTNGIHWLVFRVKVEGTVSHEQVCDFDFTRVNPRTKKDQETLFMLCKRGVNKPKALIEELYGRQQVVNKHTIAALMMDEEVHKIIARELKKLGQNIKPDKDEIARIITEQVIKREFVEDEEDKKIIKKVKRKITRLKSQSGRAANENKGQQEEH